MRKDKNSRRQSTQRYVGPKETVTVSLMLLGEGASGSIREGPKARELAVPRAPGWGSSAVADWRPEIQRVIK